MRELHPPQYKSPPKGRAPLPDWTWLLIYGAVAVSFIALNAGIIARLFWLASRGSG